MASATEDQLNAPDPLQMTHCPVLVHWVVRGVLRIKSTTTCSMVIGTGAIRKRGGTHICWICSPHPYTRERGRGVKGACNSWNGYVRGSEGYIARSSSLPHKDQRLSQAWSNLLPSVNVNVPWLVWGGKLGDQVFKISGLRMIFPLARLPP